MGEEAMYPALEAIDKSAPVVMGEDFTEKLRKYIFYGLVGTVILVFGIFLIVRVISKFV